eukprot:EG_transcript_15365
MGGVYTTIVWYHYGKSCFTKSAYEVAKAKWQPDILPTMNLVGKCYMVTGANSGLGKEVAQYLASKNASVYLVCRNAERGKKAVQEIQQATQNDKVRLIVGDCGKKSDIQRIVHEYEESENHLDGLVCNAGALLKEREVTPDGNEVTFATHLLYGTYGLSVLLEPALSRSPGQEGRVVAVSSGGMYQTALDVDDLQNMKYDGVKAYCKAKRGQVALIERWGATKQNSGVTYVSCHPGWADTPGVDSSIPTFKKMVGDEFRTTWQGAEGIAWLCVAPRGQLRSGEFYLDRAVAPKHLPKLKTAEGDTKAAVLVERLAALSGL